MDDRCARLIDEIEGNLKQVRARMRVSQLTFDARCDIIHKRIASLIRRRLAEAGKNERGALEKMLRRHG